MIVEKRLSKLLAICFKFRFSVIYIYPFVEIAVKFITFISFVNRQKKLNIVN